MDVSCPKCGKKLQVDDAMAGKEAQCPSCQTSFMLGESAPSAPAQEASPPAPPAGEPPPASPPPQPEPPAAPPQAQGPQVLPAAPSAMMQTVHKVLAFQIGPFKLPAAGLAVGGFLLFVSFFLPWWSISFAKPNMDGLNAEQKKEVKARVDIAETVLRRSYRFYYSHGIIVGPSLPGSETLWGWDTGTGIACLILGLLLIALGVVPPWIPPLRRLSWIGLVAGAFIAFILLLVTFIFMVRTPGRNAPFLSQGISIGPFLPLLANLIVLALGGTGGTIELIRFFKQQSQAPIPSAAGPPQAGPPQAAPPQAAPPQAAPPPTEPPPGPQA